MKKYLLLIPVIAVLGVGIASAHTGTKPTLTCDQVSADFTSFPDGTHNVTFVVGVNGTTSNVASSFSGNSGTASADISSLTTATGELSLTAKATWTDDGGGQTETQELKTVCHQVVVEPPKITPPPAPPVTPPPAPQPPITEGK